MNPPDGDDRYHHGDLHNQLRLVAADVITERGAAGFSLREVARRAGVSHAAPAHHYGDATGLLTAVAIDAFTHLHHSIQRATDGIDDPVEKLAAGCRAYVEVSHSNPGHCAVVFRSDLVDVEDPGYQEAGETAYNDLRSMMQELAAARNPDLDIELGTRLCWSAMQGLVVLHQTMVDKVDPADGIGEPTMIVPDIGELAETFGRTLVDGLGAAGR